MEAEPLYDFTFEIINGIKFGIEHITADEIDEDVSWLIAADFLCFRFGLIKYKE